MWPEKHWKIWLAIAFLLLTGAAAYEQTPSGAYGPGFFNGGTITNPIVGPAGSSANPTFAVGPGQGLWNNGGSTVQIQNGANAFLLDASGNAAINGNLQVGAAAALFWGGSDSIRDSGGVVTVNTVLASSTALRVTAITVASLPAAAAGNAGQMRIVSDSTAIAAEGQTCVGGGAVTALAFSNGSVQKCF